MKGADLIGWTAAVILLLTIGRQVYTEWRDKTSKGISRWLFTGQCAASVLFVIYSWLLSNWVFVATNVMLLVTAIVGQAVFLHNKRRGSRA